MRKLILSAILIAISGISNQAYSAPIMVAGMSFDDNAFVDGVSINSGSFNGLDGHDDLDTDRADHTPIPIFDALTDTNLSTYAVSVDTGSSLNMSFTNNSVFDGDGADLAFFFIGYGSNNIIDLKIGTQTRSYSAETLWIDQTAGTAHGANSTALAGIFVDFADFTESNFTQTSLTDFNVTFANDNWLALAGNFHTTTTVVPVPAAVWLFMSGLAIFGWFGRRK